MNLKEEYKKYLSVLKENAKKKGIKLRNEDVANVLGYKRTYFSTLLGDTGNITEQHIKDLKLHFPELSENVTRGTSKIFISHSSEDTENAQSIERSIEKALTLAERLTTVLEVKYGIKKGAQMDLPDEDQIAYTSQHAKAR